MAMRPSGEGVAGGQKKPKFAELSSLVSEKVGGKILFATDDWFAAAENLLLESLPKWLDTFTSYGKWMDGWETRRKRKPGHDWCIIKLGIPGVIRGVDVDTSYFTGNYAPRISLQASILSEEEESLIPKRPDNNIGTEASEEDMENILKLKSKEWNEIFPLTEAQAGYKDTCHTYVASTSYARYTHVRFNLFPDGGVARLKVFGFAVPDWSLVPQSQEVDLLSVENGGVCLEYSDAHYGHPRNLINPGRGENMADGWETARRLDRPPFLSTDKDGVVLFNGSEWCVFRLGHEGKILKIEVDTNHFKGNAPYSCRIEGCYFRARDNPEPENLGTNEKLWQTILPPQKLKPHIQHHFEKEVLPVEPISHVRIVIVPDGGLSRVRLWGLLHRPELQPTQEGACKSTETTCSKSSGNMGGHDL